MHQLQTHHNFITVLGVICLVGHFGVTYSNSLDLCTWASQLSLYLVQNVNLDHGCSPGQDLLAIVTGAQPEVDYSANFCCRRRSRSHSSAVYFVTGLGHQSRTQINIMCAPKYLVIIVDRSGVDVVPEPIYFIDCMMQP